MRLRKNYGNANRIGRNVARIRKAGRLLQKDIIVKMQASGVDISPNSYSKLEGQTRSVSYEEGYVIAEILGVSYEELSREE